MPNRACADPAILNGSFESPSLGQDAFSQSGGDFWTANNSNVFIFSNNFDNNGITPYGSQYLGLTLNGASDQQTVSGFLAGQSYVLDLFFADAPNNATPQLTVTITGAANATGIFDAPVSGPNGGNPYPFQEEELPFTPTVDGDVTLSLISTGAAGVVVDNVTIAAVPEPSSLFTMLLLSATMVTWSFRSRCRSPR